MRTIVVCGSNEKKISLPISSRCTISLKIIQQYFPLATGLQYEDCNNQIVGLVVSSEGEIELNLKVHTYDVYFPELRDATSESQDHIEMNNVDIQYEDNMRDELIQKYFKEHYKYEEIVSILFNQHNIAISTRQLKRILQRLGLKRRGITESPLADICKAIVDEIDGSGSSLGYRTLWRRLQDEIHQLFVKRDSVRKILKIVDPEGVNARAIHRLRRREYKVPGPNFLWHVDGYDKLKPYGFAIHGCIDGFSRKVLWLEVGTSNNNPEVVAHHYLKTVKKIGFLPTLIRSDRGTENVLIESIQQSLRMEHSDKLSGYKSFIKGKSTSNQRIEGFWSQLRRLGLDFWISLFKTFRDHHIFDDSDVINSEVEVNFLRYCFGPLIQYDLLRIKKEWNRHAIRRQRNTSMLFGKPNYMFYCPQKFNKKNYRKEVNKEYLNICLNEFTTKPVLYDTSFDELIQLILPNPNVPTNIEEALRLYLMLNDYVKNM